MDIVVSGYKDRKLLWWMTIRRAADQIFCIYTHTHTQARVNTYPLPKIRSVNTNVLTLINFCRYMFREEKLHGYDVIHIHFDEHLASLLLLIPFILFYSSLTFFSLHLLLAYTETHTILFTLALSLLSLIIYPLILFLYSLLYLMRCIHLNRWCENRFIDDGNRNYAENCRSGFCTSE